jgi:hypothetical protein
MSNFNSTRFRQEREAGGGLTVATRSPEVARFVERMNRERVAAGLPPTIVDTATLRIIASIVSAPRNIAQVAA